MVTKLSWSQILIAFSLILAKIHMVTKQKEFVLFRPDCLILAKIHMVTKPVFVTEYNSFCLILAKIHMVTKPQIHNSIYLKTNKS